MTWLQRYRIRHFLTNSLWFLPSASVLAAMLAVRCLHSIEESHHWGMDFEPDVARTVLSTLASTLFTFIVFVSSALLVAVQLASAQLTPRIIAIVFRDPVTKFALTLFVFVFTFSLAVLVRTTDSVPAITTRVASYGSVVSLCVFLYLIDHVGKALRPSGALRAIALLGRGVIESVYPRQLNAPRQLPPQTSNVSGEPALTVSSNREGVVLAIDVEGLVSIASRAECVIELVPQVGDFVAVGDPLFRVFGQHASLSADSLRQSIAVGQERTLEQDPALAFRMIVDIASKALSPAINDPTTAVLAIDQVHHLLRNLGRRQLDDDRVLDATGCLRVIYRTPAWEDFVHLAITEIRHFGGESIQIARRLRAMLEDLIKTLPEDRVELLRQELNLLKRSAERFFPEPEDQALAAIGDAKGVGSTGDKNATSNPA